MGPALLACDWGTTNLRAWILDREGTVLAERDFALSDSAARCRPSQTGHVRLFQIQRKLVYSRTTRQGETGIRAAFPGLLSSVCRLRQH